MDEVKVKRVWDRVKQAIELEVGSESFRVGLTPNEITLIHDLSRNGVCEARILNCTLNVSSQKIICKPIEITNTVKDFRPRVEIELSCNTEITEQRILDLYSDFIQSGQ